MVNPALAIVLVALKESIEQLNAIAKELDMREDHVKLTHLTAQYSCLAAVATDIAFLNKDAKAADDWKAIADATTVPDDSSLPPVFLTGIQQFNLMASLMQKAFAAIPPSTEQV